MKGHRFGPIWPFKKKPPKPPRYRRQRGEHERDRYDWITLWTAIAGVIIVALSTGITAWQAILTRQELNTLIAQDRAWLQLEPSVDTGLAIYSGGAFMGVSLKVKNVGTMPAYGAWGFARLYAVPAGDDVQGNAAWADDLCPAPQRYALGGSIFPGETIDVFTNPTMPSRAEVDTFENSKKEVKLILTFCVQYETAEQPIPRQTGAAYLVRRTDADGDTDPYVFRSDQDLVRRKEGITLVRLGVGDIAD